MEEAAGSIPVYSWLMVLSQLISRTCHPNSDVAGLTRDIIASVTEQYPRQAFWALVAVSRSKYKQRSKAAAEILNRAKKNIMSRLQKAAKAGEGGGEDQGERHIGCHVPRANIAVSSIVSPRPQLQLLLPLFLLPLLSCILISSPYGFARAFFSLCLCSPLGYRPPSSLFLRGSRPLSLLSSSF